VLQGYLDAIEVGGNWEVPSEDGAPLDGAVVAPLEEQGWCQPGLGISNHPGLPYKCDCPAEFSLVAVVECDA